MYLDCGEGFVDGNTKLLIRDITGMCFCVRNMVLKAATRRIERFSGTPTCKYWLAGRCNRNPCRFLHRLPSPSTHYHHNANTPSNKYVRKPQSSVHETIKQESKAVKPHSSPDKTTKHDANEVSNKEKRGRGYEIIFAEAKPSTRSICKYWMDDNCVHGDQCLNLHSWSHGDRISTLAKLHEHKKVITGISLPAGSDKLYSGSTDGTLCTWDCHTGRCVNMINLGSEISSLICEGPWIFVGVKNAVKAWNFQTAAEFTLDGPMLAMIRFLLEQMMVSFMHGEAALIPKLSAHLNWLHHYAATPKLLAA